MDTKKQGMMTLERAQHQVDCWIKKYGGTLRWRTHQYGCSCEEVRTGPRVMSVNTVTNQQEEKDNIDDEIADVLWVLLCICQSRAGVNVTEAFTRNLEKKTQRDGARQQATLRYQSHGKNEPTQNKYIAALAKV